MISIDRRHARFVMSALAASLVASLAASPSEALTGAETACRTAIGKSEAKYTKLAVQAVVKCHVARSSGDRAITVDCNAAAQADDKGKLAKTRTKLVAKIVSACTGTSLLSQYPACPAPVGYVDDMGATTEIDNFDEVGRCLFALIDDGVGDTTFDGMGSPQERMLDAIVDCQAAVGRGISGLMRAYMGRAKCQQAADSSGGGLAYTCEGTDDDGKIASAQAALADIVFDKCDYLPQSELEKLNACSDDAAGLADCAQASADLHGAELIRNAYELPEPPPTTTTTSTTTTTLAGCASTYPSCNGACGSGTFCEDIGGSCQCTAPTGECAPATVLRHLKGRYGTVPGNTQLSTGWTGKTHVVDVPDDSFDAVNVTCDSNCENCEVSLNIRQGDPTTNCRCASNPRTPCNAINGVDSDVCGGINPICNCYFGPALAISSGGTPVCVLNQVREDYSGTVDMRTGSYADVIKLSSLVHVGISQFAPCPTCDGDTTAGDGVRDGTCNGGLQNGQTCDVNGEHGTFGPVSFDCPPASTTNISGSGLQIQLNLSADSQSQSSDLPCDVGGNCPCRVCSGYSQLGCTSDAECAEAGAGTCTAGGGEVPIEANDCTGGICKVNGQCETGPVDRFFDGAVHADGRGFVSCNTDADCVALGAGACTVIDLRRCFPNPIVVEGEPSITSPATAAIFCIPATNNLAVNQTAGLPGPGTVNLEFDADVRCQSDLDLPYEFPNGDNCPQLVTTTTTTTTTIPLPSCGSATFPICGGVCPGALICTPTLVNTCVCTGA
jgi:hypothetical protein